MCHVYLNLFVFDHQKHQNLQAKKFLAARFLVGRCPDTYYLLTNRHPFDGDTREQVIQNIENGRYKNLGKEISKPWHILIRGMLRKVPFKRWSLLRISEHLYKHKYENDASLTEDSDEPAQEIVKRKTQEVKYLKVNRNTLEETKKKSPCKKSPTSRSPLPRIN